MEVEGRPSETVNELSVSSETAEAASQLSAYNLRPDPVTAQREEGEGAVATVNMQAETDRLPRDSQTPPDGLGGLVTVCSPDSEPLTACGDCSLLPDVPDEAVTAGRGQISGEQIAVATPSAEEAKESSDLLETAQALSEIATPLLTGSQEIETEGQADPFTEGPERHVLVLSTVPQESLELQGSEEVILELPNGIKMYGKNLAAITELLQPTQVLLQTGPRKFTLATADTVISAGSLVFTVSQETSQEEASVKQEDPEVEMEGKLYKCFLCSLTFNRRGNYVRHKKIHTVNTEEDARYKCPHCDRHFIQHCDLRRHTHIHTGTQPHKCDLCGKGFLRASDLVVHKRFHTKDRPFQCSQCQKSFFQSGDLRRHVRNIHMTNARMLSCGHCRKKYTKEATLLHHIQTMHQDVLLQTLEEQGQHSSEIILSEAGSMAEDESPPTTYGAEHVEADSLTSALPAEAEGSEEIALEEVPATEYGTEAHPSLPGQLLEPAVPDSARQQTQAFLGCSGTVPIQHAMPILVPSDLHLTGTAEERTCRGE
ncbi:uncharacterized protein [Heptranchias perlo]|uniref:uncharacterized protein n=1 Tax=Heptranchias perlo TaxID=212740 RepID=UPI00355A453C